MANASDVFNDEAERQNLASMPEFADDVERLAAELAGYTHCAPLIGPLIGPLSSGPSVTGP